MTASFSLVAEIGWLASNLIPVASRISLCFSLVAEIGWLASQYFGRGKRADKPFQSRCRDWVVGENSRDKRSPPSSRFSLVAEIGWLARGDPGRRETPTARFQSRCRDWVVGEA